MLSLLPFVKKIIHRHFILGTSFNCFFETMLTPSIPDSRKSWNFIQHADDPLNSTESFGLREEKISQFTQGQFIVHVDYLAGEPTMRDTMRSTEPYLPPAPLYTSSGALVPVRSFFRALTVSLMGPERLVLLV